MPAMEPDQDRRYKRVMAPRQAASWAIAASLAMACGARSTLTASGGLGGGTTAASSTGAGAGVPDSGVPDSGGPDAGADAAPPCMAWSVAPGDPIALTPPIGDSLLTSVSVEGSRVFVASANDNGPSPDPTWRVCVVSGDLQTIGPSQVVLTHGPNVSLSGMSVSTAFGNRGGIAWDEDSACRFVLLAEDGSGTATGGGVDSPCYWLDATASGFVAFSAPSFGGGPIARVTLDPTGHVLDETVGLIALDNAYPLARTRFDDATLLLAFFTGMTVTAVRVGETGGPIAGPVELVPFGSGPTVVALASMGSTGLLAWAPGDASPGEVDVEPTDENGNVTGPVSMLTGPDGTTVSTVDVKAVPGGALVAWAKGAPGAADAMIVQLVSPAGTALGPPLPVPSPKYIQTLRLAPTPEGVVVAFDAELPMTQTQVFVLRLVCGV